MVVCFAAMKLEGRRKLLSLCAVQDSISKLSPDQNMSCFKTKDAGSTSNNEGLPSLWNVAEGAYFLPSVKRGQWRDGTLPL